MIISFLMASSGWIAALARKAWCKRALLYLLGFTPKESFSITEAQDVATGKIIDEIDFRRRTFWLWTAWGWWC